MTAKLRWGILGPGAIAQTFAAGVIGSQTGILHAVASRSAATAEAFGERFGIPNRYSEYGQILEDPAVEAVYISTPHPLHAEWAIRAADAGKHVLVEKPLGINHAEAMAVVEAARRNDVFLMEGYMYRCHPQTAKLVELIRSGVVGEVRAIEASFGFHADLGTDHRLFNHAMAGGGILDVGGYPVSVSRLIAGAATGAPFAEPTEVRAVGYIGQESRVDEWTVASLKFPGDIVAQVKTATRLSTENVVRVFGSDGSLLVPAPWTLRGSSRTSKITIKRADESTEREVIIEAEADPWSNEADTVGRHINEREAPPMSWDDSLGNMRALDQWRESIGLIYDVERIDAPSVPRRVSARTARSDIPMRFEHVEGVSKPISRLIMGVDNQRAMPHASVMFDDFMDRGGNAFDSAFIYGNGDCERVLGRWIDARGVREQIVILDKGAHTPFCTPGAIRSQLKESLDRLRTDYVDIYMMHRDNPDVPVGEFIDVLNELQSSDRMRVFGASNWSIERLEAANSYAAERGLRGFSAISNNFSLARMIQPPWAGCVSSSDRRWRDWLTKTQIPLLPWSSQARGFFTGRAKPDDFSDPELVRCWYSGDNFERLARVEQLAVQRGVLPIAVALAWVLNQAFPTFPLIGPRMISETRTSMPALAIELAPTEISWLNLEP